MSPSVPRHQDGTERRSSRPARRQAGKWFVFGGFCYTQLTDVEQEINGRLTYDRRPKADLAELAKMPRARPA